MTVPQAGTYRGQETGAGSRRTLDKAYQCSIFVLMEVETLGAARSLGWKV